MTKRKPPVKPAHGRAKESKPKAATKKKKKVLVAEDPPVKSQKVYQMSLTAVELVHLRDLFGVFLPPEGEQTVSSALARVEKRSIAERLLFEKILDLCKAAKLPTQEAAPDFIIGLAANPTLGVFPISSDDDDDGDDIDVGGLISLLASADDEEEEE